MRQRAEAGLVARLAKPDSGRRRILRPDARHEQSAAGLAGAAMLIAFPGHQRPIMCEDIPDSPSAALRSNGRPLDDGIGRRRAMAGAGPGPRICWSTPSQSAFVRTQRSASKRLARPDQAPISNAPKARRSCFAIRRRFIRARRSRRLRTAARASTGVMFRIAVDDLAVVRIGGSQLEGWPLHARLPRGLRRHGDREGCQAREIVELKTTNGYLVMIAQRSASGLSSTLDGNSGRLIGADPKPA